MDLNTGLQAKRPLESPSQSSSSSQSPSEKWLNRVPKAPKTRTDSDDSEDDDDNDDNDDNDEDDNDDNDDDDPFPLNNGSEPSPESTLISGTSFTYSRTSDHKPVYMKFYLQGILGYIVALTYNMSFASDLGIATGSEKNFVRRATIEDPSNPRAYWKNAAALVLDFVKTQNPTIMYFQEMNDQVKVKKTNASFNGGYQALLELLANSGTISYSPTQLSYQSPSGSRLISYYTHGTYTGKDGKDYGFLAYSIEKTEPNGKIYPTVLTIWNTTVLGGFIDFYGNDLGLHKNYNNPFHYGRNFSCVKTRNGANLINLHGPNDPTNVNSKLKPAIIEYMAEAATKIIYWNQALTVIGGDTNDTMDLMKKIKYETTIYKYRGDAPKSCCAEFFNSNGNGRNDTLNNEYVYSGDKFLVKKFNFNAEPLFYKNILYKPSDPTVTYGGRRHSRNLKKKKSLKKRKTIKKRHYKLKNKKSFKKRRIFRRKTRKHS